MKPNQNTQNTKSEPAQTAGNQSDDFGVLIDRLDSLAHALNLPLPPEVHIKHMKNCLTELVKDFKAEYVAASGENPWEGEPK